MEGTDEMTVERVSNPSFLRTRLAAMAAILAVGIAALAFADGRNLVAPPQAATGATVRLTLKHQAVGKEVNIVASRGRSLAADAATDASVMWGSFAPATCGESACEPPALPAARSASSGRG
jgi:hypothetical protein